MKLKARDIVAGWPRGRSVSANWTPWGAYAWPPRLSDDERETLRYHEAQQRMVNEYFERWRTPRWLPCSPKKISPEEFEELLATYGREKLTYDTTAICEPPMSRYYDFRENRKWPEGQVAHIVRNSWMPESYGAGPDEFFADVEFGFS